MMGVDLSFAYGLCCGLVSCFTLLYVSRHHFIDWVLSEESRSKIEEHGQLITDLAVSSSKIINLNADIDSLNIRMETSSTQLREIQAQLLDSKSSESGIAATLTAKLGVIEELQNRLGATEALVIENRSRADAASENLVLAQQQLSSERVATEEKIGLLINAKQALTDQFKSLANEILEEKSTRFAASNATQIGLLLDPVKEKLQEFQKKVEDVYVNESSARSALTQQVTHMMEMNKSLGEEAKNLTQALKGSNKSQGNWGELVLRRILESSGLRKDHEFLVQESHQRDDGSKAIPDVIVCMPQGRNLVVDSKVSLVSFNEAVRSEDENERDALIKKHVNSLRTHIKDLASKNYQQLYSNVNSLDFVILFVPIEPAFVMAVSNDEDIFMDAWAKNVLLVSPSTLLFVLRTVEHLWKQEAQSKNAMEIAKRGGLLYDKLVGFVDDMQTVGQRIKQTQDSYEAAFGKLSTGRMNAIQQAQMLKGLGASTSKSFPESLILSNSDQQIIHISTDINTNE
jgi:DNA recombination protein RmuC